MPKYKPTHDDLYDTSSCFICGDYVLNEGDQTCSDSCKQQLEIFNDDQKWLLQEWLLQQDEKEEKKC